MRSFPACVLTILGLAPAFADITPGAPPSDFDEAVANGVKSGQKFERSGGVVVVPRAHPGPESLSLGEFVRRGHPSVDLLPSVITLPNSLLETMARGRDMALDEARVQPGYPEVEYAADLIQDARGEIVAHDLHAGTENESSIERAVEGKNVVGSVHSHPDGNTFSPLDFTAVMNHAHWHVMLLDAKGCSCALVRTTQTPPVPSGKSYNFGGLEAVIYEEFSQRNQEGRAIPLSAAQRRVIYRFASRFKLGYYESEAAKPEVLRLMTEPTLPLLNTR